MKLIVVHPFGDYVKGQEITVAAEMAKVQASNPHAVVQVATDTKTASAPKTSTISASATTTSSKSST